METRGRKVHVGRERSGEASSPGARNGLRGETQHRSRGGGGPWARNEAGEGRRSWSVKGMKGLRVNRGAAGRGWRSRGTVGFVV